ncbi:hypothetical protein ANCCAN_16493 [Ancylostoma caninum]|uniref:Uncharacterized protein n=1 Tax=Ancylostoma caninum TaxID=29170 RepID=A0A368FZH3_ANCCA|nr:hypothetical protein ANCCAN_16493 [Ancylostoma caninum]
MDESRRSQYPSSEQAEKPPSSATVREIPVLRSTSAAPSTVLEYNMPSLSGLHHGDVQDEYYRREVMTRTIITRSTEALSQQQKGLRNRSTRRNVQLAYRSG